MEIIILLSLLMQQQHRKHNKTKSHAFNGVGVLNFQQKEKPVESNQQAFGGRWWIRTTEA